MKGVLSTILSAVLLLSLSTLISCSSATATTTTDDTTTKLDADESALTITYSSGDSSSSVTGNLTLPTTGSNGSTITWSSSNTAVIANDGTVTTPQDDTEVTLTATISLSGQTTTKTFTVTVSGVDYPLWASGYPKVTVGTTTATVTLKVGKAGAAFCDIFTSAQTFTIAGQLWQYCGDATAYHNYTPLEANTESSYELSSLSAGTTYYAYLYAYTSTTVYSPIKEITFTTASN